MGALKVWDAATSTWIYAGTPGVTGPLGPTGPTGPSGGPVPVGGLPGETIQKVGAADFDVGWTMRPRVAYRSEIASVNSHATPNTFMQTCEGSMTVDPARWYHIFASVRCIQDPGATAATAQFQVAIGTVNLIGYDVVATSDLGLWGAWSQNWLNEGNIFAATAGTSVNVRLNYMLNIATKTFYSPRLYIIEY